MAKKTTAKTEKPVEKKTKTASRLEAALYVVAELKKPATFDALVKACDARYVREGGNANQKESIVSTRRAILAGMVFGYVEEDEEGTVTPCK